MKVTEYISLDQLLDLLKTKQIPSSEVVKIINKRSDFLEDLKNRTLIFKQLEKHDVSRRLYHVINNVVNVEACDCGSELHFDSLGNGYDNACQNKVCINRYRAIKVKEGLTEKYGVDNPLKIESVKRKQEDTCMERYGVKHPMQSEEIQETRRNNTIEKLGVDHHMKDPACMEKLQATNVERYGFKCSFSNKDVQEKFKKNYLEKHGVDNPFKNPDVQKLKVENCIEKYGVENPMQDAEIFSNHHRSFSKYKEFVFPSGRTVRVRGYEHLALTKLLETFHEDDLVVDNKEIEAFTGKIFYFSKDFKKHRYFPDIYVKSLNKIIEVKSIWTYEKDLEVNLLKKEASEKTNTLFEFMILDKNGNTIKINN